MNQKYERIFIHLFLSPHYLKLTHFFITELYHSKQTFFVSFSPLQFISMFLILYDLFIFFHTFSGSIKTPMTLRLSRILKAYSYVSLLLVPLYFYLFFLFYSPLVSQISPYKFMATCTIFFILSNIYACLFFSPLLNLLILKHRV
jgi:hypothetical protein